MGKKICIISEDLTGNLDEGVKNATFSLIRALKKHSNEVIAISTPGSLPHPEIEILRINLNKLFLNKALFRLVKTFNPVIIYYIPCYSATLASLIRTKVLQIFTKKKIAVIALQPKSYSPFVIHIIKFLRPGLLFVQSRKSLDFFKSLGFNVRFTPLGVDCDKFKPVRDSIKKSIRDIYGISSNDYVVSHVGHLKKNRHVEGLKLIQRLDGIQLVIVFSSSTQTEDGMKKNLESCEIKIIDGFIPDIQNIYQLSDCYVFPVKDERAAIEIPLSVLEAMACNLPVITTRFGGLPDLFEEGDGLSYFENMSEIPEKISGIKNKKISVRTRKMVEKFSWENVAKQIIECSL